jgi:hypothetical protein
MTPGDEPKRVKRSVTGGVYVILITGFLALTQMGLHYDSPVGIILVIAIGVLTVGGAWALARFIKRHGADIGEARFDTRNPDDRQP